MAAEKAAHLRLGAVEDEIEVGCRARSQPDARDDGLGSAIAAHGIDGNDDPFTRGSGRGFARCALCHGACPGCGGAVGPQAASSSTSTSGARADTSRPS